MQPEDDQHAKIGPTGPNFLPGGTAWAKAVMLPGTGESDDVLAVVKGNLYDVPAAYAAARKAKDPLLAPHGLLRALRYGERADLLRFLREFGPLEWQWDARWTGSKWREYAQMHGGEQPTAHVDAADFWRKQLHFALASQLWEAWDDHPKLKDAFVNLALKRERLARDDWRRAIPFLRFAAKLEERLPRNRAEYWTQPDPEIAARGLDFEAFVDGLRRQPERWLRHWAAMFIKSELDGHSAQREPVWCWKGSEETRVWFELKLALNSLWEGVWELLALDMAQPLGWRVCPHCGKLFYPPRKDRFYCTTEQQALASKRDWARKTRSALKAAALGAALGRRRKR